MRKVYIYVLKDPRTGAIRYVGKTVSKLKDRLTSHIRHARRENRSYRDRWILKMLAEDIKPTIEVVEETDEENWQKKERYWIAYYYEQGCKLTNETEGGEGLHGHKFSKEHREKIGRAQIGNKRGLGTRHSEEFKKKQSERMKENNPMAGRTFSPEHIAKLRAAKLGKPLPMETRKKMSEAAKGNQYGKGYKQTPEHTRKIVEAKGKKKKAQQ